ncbi:hypothetical protein F5I97DRAFT_1829544 [Phlebopus sp. FC_14]|nr:hypothetical protein F5I97DRAFT_1829544 [Phlebopus sp. FC_14]
MRTPIFQRARIKPRVTPPTTSERVYFTADEAKSMPRIQFQGHGHTVIAIAVSTKKKKGESAFKQKWSRMYSVSTTEVVVPERAAAAADVVVVVVAEADGSVYEEHVFHRSRDRSVDPNWPSTYSVIDRVFECRWIVAVCKKTSNVQSDETLTGHTRTGLAIELFKASGSVKQEGMAGMHERIHNERSGKQGQTSATTRCKIFAIQFRSAKVPARYTKERIVLVEERAEKKEGLPAMKVYDESVWRTSRTNCSWQGRKKKSQGPAWIDIAITLTMGCDKCFDLALLRTSSLALQVEHAHERSLCGRPSKVNPFDRKVTLKKRRGLRTRRIRNLTGASTNLKEVKFFGTIQLLELHVTTRMEVNDDDDDDVFGDARQPALKVKELSGKTRCQLAVVKLRSASGFLGSSFNEGLESVGATRADLPYTARDSDRAWFRGKEDTPSQ